MAKDLLIKGVSYNGVESLSIPTKGGGTASFADVSKVETWVFTLEDDTTVEKQVNVG